MKPIILAVLLICIVGCSKSSSPTSPGDGGNNSGTITVPKTVVPGIGSAYHGRYFYIQTNGIVDDSAAGSFTDSVIAVTPSSDGTSIVQLEVKSNGIFNYYTLRYEANGDISYLGATYFFSFFGPFYSSGWYTYPLQSHIPQTFTSEDTVYHTTATDSSRVVVFDTTSYVGVRRDTISGNPLVVVSIQIKENNYYDQNNTGMVHSGYLTYTNEIAPAIGFITTASFGVHYYTQGAPFRGVKYIIDSYVLKQ